MKRIIVALLLAAVLLISAAGCSVQVVHNGSPSSDGENSGSGAGTADLNGRKILIYCDEDLQAPLTEITAAFENQYSLSAEIVFGTADQLSHRIRSSYAGDVFIAASENQAGTLKTDGFIAASRPLVTRVPVLAVPSGNPGRITNLKALSRKNICLADTRSDLIGKLSISILTDNEIDPSAENISYKNGHAALLQALSGNEADASIVWYELAAEEDGVQILHSADLEGYSQTVPAMSLSTCADQDVLNAYLDFLQSGEAKKIWKAHHYEMAKQ